ncbi:MAG: hypothetical protein LPJ98_06985, partial [Cyclobacteriaceae bacterium]|nr:hypothetical protein [Cyclobacteriaceae bacterium]
MIRKLYIAAFLIGIFSSCGVKKFIPEGEHLYTGSTLELRAELSKKEEKQLQGDLESLIRPKPNSKILGVRFGLWSYYKGQKEKPGFIIRFLNKKFGERPVYLSQMAPERTGNILINRLENKGFFYSTEDFEV